MKLLRTLPLLLLFVLAPVAEAQKPVPGIQQTSQWKSMKSYVSYLGSLQNTPASSEQKATYTNTLSAKQLATNNRVKQLYSQSIKRIQARDQRQESKQIRKIRNTEKQKLQSLQAKRASALAKEKARFQSQTVAIRIRFDAEKASSQSKLQKLRRNLRRTNNPFERQVILARIDTIQENLQTIGRQEKSQMQAAKRAHRQQADQIRTRYALRITQARNYYEGLVEEVQTAWQKIYRSDVRAAKSNRQRQFTLVSSLRSQGNGYIAAMPPVS